MLSATALDHITDRIDLRLHLQQCARARGRLHRIRCVIEALDAFLAPRFMTTLCVVTVLMLASLALLS